MEIQSNGAVPERVDFSKIKTSIPIPNLIEVQKNSYERFLQMDLLPNEREDIGLQTVFNSVFPISDFRGVSDLEFVDYSIGNWECKCGNLKGLHHLRSTCRNCGATIRTDPFHAGDILCHHCGTFNKNVVTFCNKCGDPVGLQLKYDMQECQERGMTYAAPLKVTIRLTVYSKDPETQKKSVRDIKEQEVFFGEIPLMTDNGTFIINGTERVIVSQLHRSPGVFFERVPAQGYFLGKIIPYRGSWVEFEYDNKNILYVRIDRKRKFYGSVFLRALGLKTDEQILRAFYRVSKISIKDKKLLWNVDEGLTGLKLSYAIADQDRRDGGRAGQENHLVAVQGNPEGQDRAGGSGAQRSGRRLRRGRRGGYDHRRSHDRRQQRTDPHGDRQADGSRHRRVRNLLPRARRRGHGDLVHHPQGHGQDAERSAHRDLPQTASRRSADIGYGHAALPGHVLRPAQVRFFARGPHEVQYQAASTKPTPPAWTSARWIQEDFRATIKYLLKLRKGIGAVDDIDHLGNRRVRAVGELLENQFRIGLVRMERAIKEKMSVYQEMSTAMPHDLVNAKPVMAAIREFFGSSQLSQFMDQTNPLSARSRTSGVSRPWDRAV